MTRRDSTLYLLPSAFLLVISFLMLSAPSVAQDPIPTAADPSSAEQETYDLEVTVTGDNFGKDSVVKFLVTGTEEEGGIKVKNVKSLGPQKLKVTVDVEAGAVVDDFDIEVMSRGRTGKGTELFRVLEKEHPTQDTTPPGAVTVEYLGTEYNEVFLEWTAPADDGYDPASGPAHYYAIKCLPGDVEIDLSNWSQASDCYAPGFNDLGWTRFSGDSRDGEGLQGRAGVQAGCDLFPCRTNRGRRRRLELVGCFEYRHLHDSALRNRSGLERAGSPDSDQFAPLGHAFDLLRRCRDCALCTRIGSASSPGPGVKPRGSGSGTSKMFPALPTASHSIPPECRPSPGRSA